ncbi:hypothetical protein TRV_02222 [Trichophyton verrucosum HKI 0517]|uniref:Coupling of ubiquitin conjugation to ER degradation protein 1 n=1 Tax=Trichophyton verrucosum (strain HKI 0517) TaxID=663202 RepID=D4D552_TRIVH|nr:uncharacterized protein TRV_02222 [Trichophyton verrucosum HKI 0517]EFE43029.1 hypothetical protein TRV_02222 [Trichophyton verrucosum HKI 0517]
MSSFMAESEPSINIPSLLTFAVVSFFVFRWFFSSRSASQDDSNAHGGRNRAQTVDPVQLDHLAQMFPQLTRRELMWDLQRNGGSVAATTERILTGRGLETPPPTFQPQIPATSTPTVESTSTAAEQVAKQVSTNLIARYNLQSKIDNESTEGSGTGTVSSDSTILRQGSAWSRDKEERQRLMQKRRDEMILTARRKMLEKDRAAKQEQQQ